MKNKKTFILLQIALIIFASCSIFSKLASNETGLTFNYLFFMGCQLFALAVYAVLWQFVLKDMPLTIAYANKGIVLIYSALIGLLMFNEPISLTNILGMAIIIVGIIIMAKGETHNG